MDVFLENLKIIGLVLAFGISFGVGVPVLFAFSIKLDSLADKKSNASKAKYLKFFSYLILALLATLIFIGILYITKDALNNFFNLEIF